jgi:hypothetical protein
LAYRRHLLRELGVGRTRTDDPGSSEQHI